MTISLRGTTCMNWFFHMRECTINARTFSLQQCQRILTYIKGNLLLLIKLYTIYEYVMRNEWRSTDYIFRFFQQTANNNGNVFEPDLHYVHSFIRQSVNCVRAVKRIVYTFFTHIVSRYAYNSLIHDMEGDNVIHVLHKVFYPTRFLLYF